MKRSFQRLVVFLCAGIVSIAVQPAAQGCAACFGKSDSDMAKGMNMGIFALLVVITTVLGGTATFFICLARRAAAYAAANEVAEASLNSVEIKSGVS